MVMLHLSFECDVGSCLVSSWKAAVMSFMYGFQFLVAYRYVLTCSDMRQPQVDEATVVVFGFPLEKTNVTRDPPRRHVCP